MKFAFAILLLVLSSQTRADEKFVCSIVRGKELYQELKTQPIDDKAKHCILSCYLALRCPAFEVWNLGVLKELYDLVTPGDADMEDLKADAAGISLAVGGRARNRAECFRECRTLYPNN